MATFTAKRMAPVTTMTTSPVTIYTVGASTTGVVKQVILVNTSGASAKGTVNVVQSAGAASAGNQIIPAITVPPNNLEVFDFNIVLATGDFISVVSDTASAINISVSGLEVV